MSVDINFEYQKVCKIKKREGKLSKILDNVSSESNDNWIWIEDGPRNLDGTQFCDEITNYFWFGRLSEIRGPGPRITKVGLPQGVHDERRFKHKFGLSHIYLSELVNQHWTREDHVNFGWFIRFEIQKMVKYCEENDLRQDEFRIIISYN